MPSEVSRKFMFLLFHIEAFLCDKTDVPSNHPTLRRVPHLARHDQMLALSSTSPVHSAQPWMCPDPDVDLVHGGGTLCIVLSSLSRCIQLRFRSQGSRKERTCQPEWIWPADLVAETFLRVRHDSSSTLPVLPHE